jgi:hypothetical protein
MKKILSPFNAFKYSQQSSKRLMEHLTNDLNADRISTPYCGVRDSKLDDFKRAGLWSRYTKLPTPTPTPTPS